MCVWTRTWQGGDPTPFLLLLFNSPPAQLLWLVHPTVSWRVEICCNPWGQWREGPLKAAPTQLGRWSLATNEKITQRLTHTGWNSNLSLFRYWVYLRGTDVGASLYCCKIGLVFWDQVKLHACRPMRRGVALQQPNALQQWGHNALQQTQPTLLWGLLQSPMLRSIIARLFQCFCSTGTLQYP